MNPDKNFIGVIPGGLTVGQRMYIYGTPEGTFVVELAAGPEQFGGPRDFLLYFRRFIEGITQLCCKINGKKDYP